MMTWERKHELRNEVKRCLFCCRFLLRTSLALNGGIVSDK